MSVIVLGSLWQALGREAWQDTLTTAPAGPHPQVRPFEGTFRFGWSNLLDAADAKASLEYKDDKVRVNVQGGTTGLARALWRLDAIHKALFYQKDFQSIDFWQEEKYKNRTTVTEAVWKEDGVWRLRKTTPGGEAKWKRIKVTPLRDIIAAMLYLRSQPLANGDKLSITAFPGDSPFLVDVTVLGREEVSLASGMRKAIKLDFRLQRIQTKGKTAGQLEPHGKFRRGTVWLSDDDDRFPLRAEVDIFIGFVFGELVDVTFKDTPAN